MNHKLHFLFLLGTTIFGSTQLTFSMNPQNEFEADLLKSESSDTKKQSKPKKEKVLKKKICKTKRQGKTLLDTHTTLTKINKKFTAIQQDLEELKYPSTIEYIKVTSFLAGSTIVGFAIYNKLFGPQKQLTTMQNDLLEIKALLTKTAPIALQADTIIK